MMLRDKMKIALMVLIICSTSLYANMAPLLTHKPGSTISEPIAKDSHISVTQEHISIDARPLAQNKPVVINVKYHFLNKGQAKNNKIIFITDILRFKDFKVTVNNIPARTELMDIKLPPSWIPPRSTPSLVDNSSIPYITNTSKKNNGNQKIPIRKTAKMISFNCCFTKGYNNIAVAYSALATEYHGNSHTKIWQLAYILAPAKQWASFQNLAVNIYYPPGWDIKTTPAMQASNNSLSNTWTKLPADSIGITMQARTSWLTPARFPAMLILLTVFLLLLRFSLNKYMGFIISKSKSFLWTTPVVLLLAFIAVIFTVFLAVFEAEWVKLCNVSQYNWNYGRGRIYLLLIFPLIFGVEFIIIMIYSIISYRNKIKR